MNESDDLLSTVGGAHVAKRPTGYGKMRKSLGLSASTELHAHQQAAVAWMMGRETNSDKALQGGILADGPGLGKTLTMLSVIQLGHSPRPTLVVVPNQIIAQQWMHDMSTHFAAGTWSASIFDASTPIDESHRIVIILMKDLAKEWHRRQSELSERGRSVSALYHVSWCRICVDEVQEILGKSSLAAQMMQQLEAPIRWGLSGTPVSKVADIAGVAQFLQLAPYDSSQWWRQHGHAAALKLVQPILDQIVWRTSSQHVSHSLQLPTQTILPTTYVQLSAIEFAAYRPQFERYIKDIRKRIAAFEDNPQVITLHELRQLLNHPAVLSLCKGASHVSFLAKATTSAHGRADFIAHMATRQREQCGSALSQWLEACLPCPNELQFAYKTWQDYGAEIALPWQMQLKVLSAMKQYAEDHDDLRYRHQVHRTILDSPCQRRLPVILWQRVFAYLHEDFSDHRVRVAVAQLQPLQAAFQDSAAAFWAAHAASWSQDEFQTQVEASYDLEPRIQQPEMLDILNDFTNMRVSEAKSRVGIFERPTLWHYLRNKTTESVDVDEIRMVTLDLLGQCLEQYSASLKLLHDLMHADWDKELPKVVQGFSKCNHATRRLDRTLVVGREERWQRRDNAHGQGRGQLSLGTRCVVCALRNRIDMASSFLVTEGKSLTLMVVFFTVEAPPAIRLVFHDCISRLEHMLSLATLLDNWLRTSCEVQNCMATSGLDLSLTQSKRVELARDKFQMANLYRHYTNAIAALNDAPSAPILCDLCGNETSRSTTSLLLCCHRFCATCVANAAAHEAAQHNCLVCHRPQPFAVTKAPRLPSHVLACGSKMDVILHDIASIAPRDKCVVFSQFPEVLDLVMAELTDRNVRCVQLRSGNQIALRHAFQSDDDVRVLLLPLKKYNHGLNLVEATHVFLLEPSLQPALHAQAMARVKRLNQTRPTYVHRYVMRDTVEEAVEAAVTHNNHRLAKMDIYRIFAHDAFKSM